MYCEIPVFKRCCCCLPLRRGLLGYAYLKLAIVLTWVFLWYSYYGPVQLEGQWICIFVFVGIDVAMTVALISGAHKKNPRPLKAYIGYCIVTTALLVLFQTYALFRMKRISEHVIVSTGFDVLIQLYLIFLIRSEVLKLESQAGIVHSPINEDDDNFKSETV